jgi:predicted enzyme related to lactoylglutathione lyase
MMQTRKTYLPGVPCWVDTMQPDPEAATAFYGELFGWEFENQAPTDAPGPYYVARLQGHDVAAIGGPESVTPFWNTYTAVDNVDQTTTLVREAGGKIVVEPTEVPGAGRMAVYTDPEGATFSAWEAGAFIGAALVNEPGSWNFSELHTRAPVDAARFYHSVFGWELLSFSMGDSAFTFFTRPGYGDFLARDNPAIRENQAADGATAGFEDAVAWLMDESADQDAAGNPPRWTVTFAVDDADDIAARAERLGAKILVPPFDAEPVRMTVIADPQGTVFTASKYQPNREP